MFRVERCGVIMGSGTLMGAVHCQCKTLSSFFFRFFIFEFFFIFLFFYLFLSFFIFEFFNF